MNNKNILIVDDEKSFRELLEILFEEEGYETLLAKSTEDAISVINEHKIDIIISDLVLGKDDGLDIARYLKENDLKIPFILMTAYASASTALESVRIGVYDYITKPFDNNKLLKMVGEALKAFYPEEDEQNLIELYNLIGVSGFMKYLRKNIIDIAPTDSNVLISGESGTGKEVVAKSIHKVSKRKNYPFIAINCGAIPSELLESELFGYKKGSFTGANADKKGIFETASGGTIFLDEIGEMPQILQVKLLRVLQERKIMPVGANEEIPINVRIITATNRDLEMEIRTGRFRRDLYYRINVVHIHLSPLRERTEDIEPLAQHFLIKYSDKMGKKVNDISYPVLEFLKSHRFDGNIRELENIIEKGVALEKTDRLLPSSILDYFNHTPYEACQSIMPSLDPNSGINLEKIVENIERKYIIESLKIAAGNQTKAAKLLRLTPRIFRYKQEKYNVKQENF